MSRRPSASGARSTCRPTDVTLGPVALLASVLARYPGLLAVHDGWMRQNEMVEAADWSKATVSRVLSDMEEAREVTRIDIGQRNLVALPGETPLGAASPYTDE
jgi:hypothetical protein